MIWFRVDANNEIGTGHVMRCLTVAKELRAMGERVFFLTADENPIDIIAQNGFSYIVVRSAYDKLEGELGTLGILMAPHKPDIVVVDSYFATPTYLEKIVKATNVAVFDDMGHKNRPADLLVNYNLYANEEMYQGGKQKKSLLGATYAPLREEFGNSDYQVRERAKKVLITTGGSDKFNLAGRMLEVFMAAEESAKLEYEVVCGAYNVHLPELEALAEKYPNIKIHTNVKNMAELMKQCDIAITAGGSTIYEISAVGVPFLCFSFAENQEQLVRAVGENQSTIYAGNYLTEGEEMFHSLQKGIVTLASDFELRKKQSQQIRSMVDGQGARRIAEEIVALKR